MWRSGVMAGSAVIRGGPPLPAFFGYGGKTIAGGAYKLGTTLTAQRGTCSCLLINLRHLSSRAKTQIVRLGFPRLEKAPGPLPRSRHLTFVLRQCAHEEDPFPAFPAMSAIPAISSVCLAALAGLWERY